MQPDPGGDPRPWTIGELNRRANHAVIKQFRGRIWGTGELTRLDERRGNWWLEFVERGGGRDGRDAHLAAVCWASQWQRLERKLAGAGVQLQVGQRLVVAGCLELGDRGNLTLIIDDVDVAALMGDRLRDRQRLVQRLIDDDLFDANRRLLLTRLPLRIGVVASSGSDGHRDLLRQLEASEFMFEVTMRTVPVEGPAAPRAIQAALATFGPDDIDVAVVVRGGGSKASLDVFDRPNVAHAVATALVPVFTGIGHAGDRTVADEVAYRSLATPSAVGQELVDAVATAWDDLAKALGGIARLVHARLATTTSDLDVRRREVATLARSQLERHAHAHAQTSSDLQHCASRCLDIWSGDLTITAHTIRALGGAELRNARRQLTNLALDTEQAGRRTCIDCADELAASASRFKSGVADALRSAGEPIGRAAASLTRARFDGVFDDQRTRLERLAGRIERDTRRRLDDHYDRASSRRAVLEAYDPRRQLTRGWTLTHTLDGRLIRDVRDLSEGEALVTTFATGEAASTVTAVTPRYSEVPNDE
jgi:exodeoxyribonuclease VII large subunit